MAKKVGPRNSRVWLEDGEIVDVPCRIGGDEHRVKALIDGMSGDYSGDVIYYVRLLDSRPDHLHQRYPVSAHNIKPWKGDDAAATAKNSARLV